MDQNQTASGEKQTAAPRKNPLSNYYRQPKIFISLPSRGNYYANGALDRTDDNQYPVYAMTAKDELMYKTPDALLSGQATVEVIRSCIPAIQDPWSMPSLDVDAALVAIRIATYGKSMEVNSTCPHCKESNEYDLDLIAHLGKLTSFDYDPDIRSGELMIHLRPYTYREITKIALRSGEQEKIFRVINNESLSEDEKLEQFGQSFIKLTELTIDIVAGCIKSITTPDGEEVTDREFIAEFIDNAPKEVFNTINDRISAIAQSLNFNVDQVECNNCHEKYDLQVTIDQANFFAARS